MTDFLAALGIVVALIAALIAYFSNVDVINAARRSTSRLGRMYQTLFAHSNREFKVYLEDFLRNKLLVDGMESKYGSRWRHEIKHHVNRHLRDAWNPYFLFKPECIELAAKHGFSPIELAIITLGEFDSHLIFLDPVINYSNQYLPTRSGLMLRVAKSGEAILIDQMLFFESPKSGETVWLTATKKYYRCLELAFRSAPLDKIVENPRKYLEPAEKGLGALIIATNDYVVRMSIDQSASSHTKTMLVQQNHQNEIWNKIDDASLFETYLGKEGIGDLMIKMESIISLSHKILMKDRKIDRDQVLIFRERRYDYSQPAHEGDIRAETSAEQKP